MECIEEFNDKRQKSWCIHCGALIAETATNSDHVPSKSLLDRPLPPNTPQVEICRRCNNNFSLDEEYLVVFLSCAIAGSTDPDAHSNRKVQRALRRNPALRARIESSKSISTSENAEEIIWHPEMTRVLRVVLKNARGHVYFEYGEPILSEPNHVWAQPLASMDRDQRIIFENVGVIGDLAGRAEVGSRMMTRQISEQDMEGRWIVVQPRVYRYAVFQAGSLTVRSVLRDYLATEAHWD
jgi:hypothetical protein